MVSAENAALANAKVGGIGDVVRDVPRALAERDCKVSVVIPAYGSLHQLTGASRKISLIISFAGRSETIDIYRLDEHSDDKVSHYVVEHPIFSSCGIGKIYCNDPAGRPFAQDATKFALFCTAVAEAIVNGVFGELDLLHLHDWHAALLLILRRFMPRYKSLKKLHCTYSIHNLALQGIRPFSGDESSLQQWFPDMKYDRKLLVDPRWSDCVNPMASAIRLADTVHAVSPSYAEEIQRPSQIEAGLYGGEGLEKDLINANGEQRLFGILNGCTYADGDLPLARRPAWPGLLQLMRETLLRWISRSEYLSSSHFIASHSLTRLASKRPKMLLTSVGRITDQKVGLMRHSTSSGKPALHAALEAMGDYAMLLILGSGDSDYEQFLSETATQYSNIVFLRGYSDGLADAFYQHGDLFFMPSSFEPCGISQMLALRAGQPCLVHEVGGLRDTVIDGKTGFTFSGNRQTDQADALAATVKRAVTQHRRNPDSWKNMRKAAAASRFEWADSIDAYLKYLYKVS